jgi:hypothetical protein
MMPSMGAVLFNSNNLETLVPGLTCVGLPIFVPPKRSLSQYVLANMSKVKVTQGFFTQRVIPITFVITRPTRALLDGAFDSLWPLLAGTEQDLITVESNGQRRYTATWSDFNLKESKGGYAKFDLLFTCSDQYGYDPTYTLLLDQSPLTSLPQSLVMADIGGSAEWQAPIFEIWLSALTGGTSASVSLGNPANGQTVTITRTFVAGDYIEIDSQAKTVKVNNVLVDFTGSIPEWQPRPLVLTGQSKVTYSDTLTTRSARLRGKYYRRWA